MAVVPLAPIVRPRPENMPEDSLEHPCHSERDTESGIRVRRGEVGRRAARQGLIHPLFENGLVLRSVGLGLRRPEAVADDGLMRVAFGRVGNPSALQPPQLPPQPITHR